MSSKKTKKFKLKTKKSASKRFSFNLKNATFTGYKSQHRHKLINKISRKLRKKLVISKFDKKKLSKLLPNI